MKSFRRTGISTACLTCSTYSSRPWKYFSSVSTLIASAPQRSYVLAMATGSKSARISPADGDAFLTSAITLSPRRFALVTAW